MKKFTVACGVLVVLTTRLHEFFLHHLILTGAYNIVTIVLNKLLKHTKPIPLHSIFSLNCVTVAYNALNKSAQVAIISGPVKKNAWKREITHFGIPVVYISVIFFFRLDTWECEQPTWLETVRVLRHHKNILNEQCNANTKVAPTKKRRKNMENEHINEGKYSSNSCDWKTYITYCYPK